MIQKLNSLFGLPTKMVMDPVHGGIPFFSHEQQVIDHPLFQRLRHILQNDILTLVFPGSQHTRFQHSIGVMHLTGQFFQHLIKAYIYQFKNPAKLTPSLIESINYVYCCLRMSALLHDTGHCPFSHQFEHSDKVKSELTPEIFKEQWKNEDYKKYFKKVPSHFEHEHISIRIAHEIFKSTGNYISANDVIYFMEKSENDPSKVLIDHSLNIIKALGESISQLQLFAETESIKSENIHLKLLEALKTIISGEIDADKMDYVLRDSYFSGSKYGIYNIAPILHSLRIGYQNKGSLFSSSTWVGIALDPKAIRAVEDFIYGRYQLYLELYNHKTVCGFKYLLSKALDESLESEGVIKKIRNCLADVSKFHLLTDSFLWEKFKEIAIEKPNSACSRMVNRSRLEYVLRGINLTEVEIEGKKIELENGLRKKICYWKSPLKFSKINDYFDSIKILKKSPEGKLYLVNIKEETKFFDLFKKEVELIHFFIDPNLD